MSESSKTASHPEDKLDATLDNAVTVVAMAMANITIANLRGFPRNLAQQDPNLFLQRSPTDQRFLDLTLAGIREVLGIETNLPSDLPKCLAPNHQLPIEQPVGQ